MHEFLHDPDLKELIQSFLRVGILGTYTSKSLKFKFDLPGGEEVTVGYIDYHRRLWTDTTCRPPYRVCHAYLKELAEALDLEIKSEKQNPEIWSLRRNGAIPSIGPLRTKLCLWPPIADTFKEQMLRSYVPPVL